MDEQLARSNLGDTLSLVDTLDRWDQVQADADAFLLCSRQDATAFAGVAAALLGLPVVCFDGASGLAEVLKQDNRVASLAVPYLDLRAAAERLAELALHPGKLQAGARVTQMMARSSFNRVRHTAVLDALGLGLAARRAAREAQVSWLIPDDAFDANLYFGIERQAGEPRQTAIRKYLENTLNVDWSGPAVESHHPRRPLAGFNPFIYAHLAPGFGDRSDLDPLVDYIRNGRPAGAWQHEVIPLSLETLGSDHLTGLRIAIHGHFHYTESFGPFLDALEVNSHPIDLLLTTTTVSAAETLRAMTAERFSGGQVQVEVGLNAGRDIGPFLALLQERLEGYDVVGHIHGKRSAHARDPSFGDRWRQFLWQHLLGPAAPVVDVLAARFASDLDLGLVFPENEHLIGWEQNRAVAEALACRLGISRLPEHIEFPVGTMFWARPSALKLLREARFTAADYPAEPLDLDGTVLHALERLLPLVVEAAGFRYATTHFPLFTR